MRKLISLFLFVIAISGYSQKSDIKEFNKLFLDSIVRTIMLKDNMIIEYNYCFNSKGRKIKRYCYQIDAKVKGDKFRSETFQSATVCDGSEVYEQNKSSRQIAKLRMDSVENPKEDITFFKEGYEVKGIKMYPNSSLIKSVFLKPIERSPRIKLLTLNFDEVSKQLKSIELKRRFSSRYNGICMLMINRMEWDIEIEDSYFILPE